MEKLQQLLQIETLNAEKLAVALKNNGHGYCFDLIIERNVSGKQLLNIKEFQLKQWRLPIPDFQKLWSYIERIKDCPQELILETKSKQKVTQRNQSMSYQLNRALLEANFLVEPVVDKEYDNKINKQNTQKLTEEVYVNVEELKLQSQPSRPPKPAILNKPTTSKLYDHDKSIYEDEPKLPGTPTNLQTPEESHDEDSFSDSENEEEKQQALPQNKIKTITANIQLPLQNKPNDIRMLPALPKRPDIVDEDGYLMTTLPLPNKNKDRNSKVHSSTLPLPPTKRFTNAKQNRPLPSPPTGKLVRNNSDSLIIHENYLDVDRYGAATFLINMPRGSFLLRKSKHYFCTLAVKGARILNIPINKNNDGVYLLTNKENVKKTFLNLRTLIQYYRKNPIPLEQGDLYLK